MTTDVQMLLTDEHRQSYRRNGYVTLRNVLPISDIDRLEQRFLGLVYEYCGQRFTSAHSEEFAQFLIANRELERKLYDGIRGFPWLTEFGCIPPLASIINALHGESSGLMSKIPFRLDLPGVTRELAVWHQDYFYVKGNTDIITAWIPLQDTPYERGCLLVMPQSHELGPLNHDAQVLGKRHYPTAVFEREVRYVPMAKGDLLLFNSLLLHSSGLNISQTPRFSVQCRYTKLSLPADASMGEVIPLPV